MQRAMFDYFDRLIKEVSSSVDAGADASLSQRDFLSGVEAARARP
jgi:hypothetical protein